MAIVYGLTDEGLVIRTREVIREDINSQLRQLFGNSINLSDRSILGQIVGIISDRIGEVWELLEQVNSSQDPDKATKTLLDALCTLTGTFRPHAASSTVTLTLTGTNSTVIPFESEFATASTAKSFTTLDPATLTVPSAWTGLTAYVVGDRVLNTNVYDCIQAGTSAASPGPVGSNPDLVADGTCLWTFVGVGPAAADVDAVSVELGPIVATRKDITTIVNSIGGLVSVTNLADASLGRLDAEDSELRILREDELSVAGSSPFDALLGQLRRVDGVTAVTLFPNNTDTTDADGVPPHSVESLVRGGEDQDIWDALLANVAAGIGTHGTTIGTAEDSQGTLQTEKFSRPELIPIFVRLAVIKSSIAYPADGDDQVKAAVIAFGATQGNGRDAVPEAIAARGFKIVGVLNVPSTSALVFTDVIGTPAAWVFSTPYVATVGSRSVVTNDGGRTYICITSGTSAGSGGPTGVGTDITDGTAHWYFLGNTVAISTRQLATYETAHITVTSTNGTP